MLITFLIEQMKILQLVSLKQYILLVFYTDNSCYQFSLIDPHGYVYSPRDIFDTSLRAEKEGRLALHLAS